MNHIDPRRALTDISIYSATALGVLILGAVYLIDRESIPAWLIAGILVYLGFALPRWIGRKERLARALAAKQLEKGKWSFHSRDRDGAWINYIDYPLVKRTAYADGKYFYSEWLIIHNGYIVVDPGESTVNHTTHEVSYKPRIRRTYAWDGCTPKRMFYWLALIGTPDWWQQCEDVQVLDGDGNLLPKSVFWPKAHHASLVHDALYQYLGHIPITKRDVDQLFCDMLIDSKMPRSLARLYQWAVHRFGAPDIPPGHSASDSPLVVTGLPFLPPRPNRP